MTSSNMQEAREGATDLCFALLEHYKIHQEISHELLKNTLLSVIEKSEARGRLAGLEEVAKIIDTAIKEAHRVITTCRSNGSETHLDRWHERLICLEGLANAIRQRSSK